MPGLAEVVDHDRHARVAADKGRGGRELRRDALEIEGEGLARK
jgi:hypothetical protein